MGWPENQWRCDKCVNIQTGEISWNGKCQKCNIKDTENYLQQEEKALEFVDELRRKGAVIDI